MEAEPIEQLDLLGDSQIQLLLRGSLPLPRRIHLIPQAILSGSSSVSLRIVADGLIISVLAGRIPAPPVREPSLYQFDESDTATFGAGLSFETEEHVEVPFKQELAARELLHKGHVISGETKPPFAHIGAVMDCVRLYLGRDSVLESLHIRLEIEPAYLHQNLDGQAQ